MYNGSSLKLRLGLISGLVSPRLSATLQNTLEHIQNTRNGPEEEFVLEQSQCWQGNGEADLSAIAGSPTSLNTPKSSEDPPETQPLRPCTILCRKRLAELGPARAFGLRLRRQGAQV